MPSPPLLLLQFWNVKFAPADRVILPILLEVNQIAGVGRVIMPGNFKYDWLTVYFPENNYYAVVK